MHAQDLPCFEKNLAVLSEAHPELAHRLKQEGAPDPAQASVEPGRRGLPALKIVDESGAFYLNSVYDPVAEAERLIAAETSGKEFNVVVQIGLGLGYTLDALLAHVDDNTTLVVVEPHMQVLRLALQARDLSSLLDHPRIVWSVGDEVGTAVVKIMAELSLLKLIGWVPLVSAATHRLHKTYIDELINKLSSEVSGQRLSKATELVASELFLKNSFINLPQALGAPGVLHLYRAWDGKPAVIVSAGPSLEKQLDLLRAHQDKILLIAVGAAWKSLRAADIEPHMVVTVDPFPDNYPHFEGLDARREWLITDFACNTDVVSTFKGRKIFCHSTPQKEALFRAIYGEWGLLLTGGSVANSALSLALTMGASPIILVGQDLAYTGGISHATGHTGKHTLADAIAANPADFTEVPGYADAEPVLTNTQMDAYRRWFERVIGEIEADRVINATEGGARIAGALERPFAEVLDQYAEAAITLDKLWPAKHANQAVSIKRIKANLAKIEKKIGTMQALANDAVAVMNTLVERADRGADCAELERQYNSLARKMGRQDRIADFFLTAFIQNEIFLTQRRQNLLGHERSDKYQTNLLLQSALPVACERAIEFLRVVSRKLDAGISR